MTTESSALDALRLRTVLCQSAWLLLFWCRQVFGRLWELKGNKSVVDWLVRVPTFSSCCVPFPLISRESAHDMRLSRWSIRKPPKIHIFQWEHRGHFCPSYETPKPRSCGISLFLSIGRGSLEDPSCNAQVSPYVTIPLGMKRHTLDSWTLAHGVTCFK